LLLLVMLVPAFGPLAVACAARPMAMHCMRQPVSGQAAQSAMPCHQAMGQAPAESESSKAGSSETSVQAIAEGNCCHSHCCCGATTSEWARPTPRLLSVLHLLIEPVRPSPSAPLHSSDTFGHDSARAPPRG